MQDRFLTHLSTRLLVAALCVFPMPSLHAQAPTDTTTIAAPATPSGPTIPSGTVALLTLVTPINKKVSKPGDTVRAAIAFPVTVGNQIALPIGTIAEGQIATIERGEITPAMIRVGVDALWPCEVPERVSAAEVVARVFAAMESRRSLDRSSTQCAPPRPIDAPRHV